MALTLKKSELGQTDSQGAVGDSQTRVSEERTQRTGNSEPIEITEEIIDSLPVDDLVKLYAKQYLNGKQNTVTRSAYQTIKDYVQNLLSLLFISLIPILADL